MSEANDLITYLVNQGSVWVDKDIWGGAPCLNGYRIPISQIFVEMSGGPSAREIALDYEIPEIKILNLFKDISDYVYKNYPGNDTKYD